MSRDLALLIPLTPTRVSPHTGRALCAQPVAIAWSAEDAAGTEIDCRGRLVAMDEMELAG
jgi:hypothetical protein